MVFRGASSGTPLAFPARTAFYGGAMAEVVLKEIDRESWQECMNLVLRLEQGGLVAPHRYNSPFFAAEPTFVQLGIYADGEMVGYAMYGRDPDDGEYWIYRLMVDEAHQGKGLGKAAVEKMIDMLRNTPDCHRVYAGYRPENYVAGAFLWTMGFERTGQMLQGEYITCLNLNGETPES